jgi:nucleoid-associated protein EbfC
VPNSPPTDSLRSQNSEEIDAVADPRSSGDDSVDFVLLAERARQMRQQLERVRADIGRLEAHGLGGNGLVQATLSGDNVLVALTIDSSIIDPDDPETLSELVREAVNDAMTKLAAQRGERFSSVTDGLAGMASAAGSREMHITPMTAARRRPTRPDGKS